jgi:hypothetical protein
MTSRTCSLLPLGRVIGEEALDVWEHIAFSCWMETHALPGEDARERFASQAFEEEFAYWEGLVFRGHREESTLLDSTAFDEDDSHLYEWDSSEDYD